MRAYLPRTAKGEATMEKVNSAILLPESLQAAGDMLHGQSTAVLAGGTDIIPLIKYGARKPGTLLSLHKLDFLRSIEMTASGMTIGSMATLADVAGHPAIRKHFPAVAQAALSVATPGIRNTGTIGGNLLQDKRCLYYNQTSIWRESIAPCFKLGGGVCHQIPNSKTCRAIYYADMAPPLLAYEARAEVYDGQKSSYSLREVIDRHTSDSGLAGILTGVFLSFPHQGTRAAFVKMGVRAAIDFGVITMALRHSPGQADGPAQFSFFVGAAAPVVIDMQETAQAFLDANSQVGEILDTARRELTAKSSLIRETAVPPLTKKMAITAMIAALEDFLRRCS